MKKILIMLMIILFSKMFGDRIVFNMFFDPKINPEKLSDSQYIVKTQSRIQEVTSDSLADVSLNFFGGEILSKTVNDTLIINSLELFLADYIFPLDYQFKFIPTHSTLKVLGSNIFYTPKKNLIIDELIVETDSLKIGVLSIFTPDFKVKNEVSDSLQIDYSFFEKTKSRSKELSTTCDLVLVFSSLSRFVNERLAQDSKINAIISFDYAKKSITKFGDVDFFNIKYKQKYISKLIITKENGKTSYKFVPIKFSF